MLPMFVNPSDGGVLQLADGANLIQKSGNILRVLSERFGQQLDGNRPIVILGVVRQIDLRHAAFAQVAYYGVAGYLRCARGDDGFIDDAFSLSSDL